MLVNATEMLIKARDGHYGVPQFNINNLEWTKAVLTACEEMKSPVILGVSEGAGKYMTGFKTVAAMVDAMVDSMGITVPVALHLDHGTYEGCKACVEAGFSSIMFDGSHYSIEENVEKTKELVALAHSKGMSIEAEVGSIGGVEDGVVGNGEIADPAECAKITDLGIDFLAAGIGNIHGVYPANWKGLDFEALDRIHKATNNIPLVLHGGTGIPDDMIAKAISLGVSKININTECQLVFAEATRKYIEEGKDQQGKGFDPRKLLAPGSQAIIDKCKEKIELFGCAGKGLASATLLNNTPPDRKSDPAVLSSAQRGRFCFIFLLRGLCYALHRNTLRLLHRLCFFYCFLKERKHLRHLKAILCFCILRCHRDAVLRLCLAPLSDQKVFRDHIQPFPCLSKLGNRVDLEPEQIFGKICAPFHFFLSHFM